MDCSIGIFAHNEEANITHLLESVCSQKLRNCSITEVIVVSSASTDSTDSLVRRYVEENPLIRLITQEKREGKSSAINLFIHEAISDILAVISGDVILAPDTIEKLVSPLMDATIGATGGKPMPVNKQNTFMGYAVHLFWRLHHRMALISPKLGEMIVFRKVMDCIPAESAVDEASIEALIRDAGLSLLYVPDAIIHNKGPENLRDYIKQRRRIQNGHLWLINQQGYKVISQDQSTLFKVILTELWDNPFDIFKIKVVILLELYCRILGSWDYYVRKKNPFTWDIALSTKRLNS